MRITIFKTAAPLLAITAALLLSSGCKDDNQIQTPHGIGAPIQSVSAPLPEIPEYLGASDYANPQSPLKIERFRKDGVPFVLIEGGIAGTRRAAIRRGVEQFVQESGAQAGLNGTFFANASLSGTDNLLIGPSLCGNEDAITRSPYDQKAALAGRPFILISSQHTRILPYDPYTMADPTEIHRLLPGLTDAFVGGVWLVNRGLAASSEQIGKYQVHDAEDPRRRAFFAVMADGRPALGATSYVATSAQLAKALQDTGIQEAVLLDSGFSTSLVYGRQILVTGHTARGIPSRPVPHSLVLFDTRPAAAVPGTKVARRF